MPSCCPVLLESVPLAAVGHQGQHRPCLIWFHDLSIPAAQTGDCHGVSVGVVGPAATEGSHAGRQSVGHIQHGFALAGDAF